MHKLPQIYNITKFMQKMTDNTQVFSNADRTVRNIVFSDEIFQAHKGSRKMIDVEVCHRLYTQWKDTRIDKSITFYECLHASVDAYRKNSDILTRVFKDYDVNTPLDEYLNEMEVYDEFRVDVLDPEVKLYQEYHQVDSVNDTKGDTSNDSDEELYAEIERLERKNDMLQKEIESLMLINEQLHSNITFLTVRRHNRPKDKNDV